MDKRKLKFVIFTIAILIFTYISFNIDNFSKFFSPNDAIVYTKSSYSIISSRFFTFLCVLLVWITGKDNLDKKDSLKMKLIFLIIFAGDMLMYYSKTIEGISVYAAAQILLTVRNSKGLWTTLHRNEFKSKLKLLVFLGFSFALFTIVLMSTAGRTLLQGTMFYFSVVYLVLLLISLWAAAANYLLNLFPKYNSNVLLFGMILFFISDLFTGFSVGFKTGFNWLICDSFTWVFFPMAILLVALSGYSFKRN